MKPRVLKWTCPVYKVNFAAFYTAERDAVAFIRRHSSKSIWQQCEGPVRGFIDSTVGFCTETLYDAAARLYPNTMYIWIQRGKRPAYIDLPELLAHEALHATHFTLGRCGLRLTDESQEAYTYYQGWIIRHLRQLCK